MSRIIFSFWSTGMTSTQAYVLFVNMIISSAGDITLEDVYHPKN
jgi:hypothetical protein